MPQRNRVPYAPFGVGLAIALALIGVGLHNQSHNPQAADQATQKQDAYGLERFPSTSIAAVKQQAPVSDPNPDRKEWREEQDLKAQWQMAYWALGVLIATGLGVGVTAVGVVYVKRTLELNRALLRETVEAAERHERVGRAQVRAYLTIADVHIELEQNSPAVFFTVYNSGNSPAFDVEVNAGVWYRVAPGRLPRMKQWEMTTGIIGTLRAGDQRDSSIGVDNVVFPTGTDATPKKFNIKSRLTVSYVDVFAELQFDNFDFFKFWADLAAGEPIVLKPIHDDYVGGDDSEPST